MKKLNLKSYVLGISTSIIILSLVVPAFAASIEATLNSIGIVVNGEQVSKIDESLLLNNGTEVPYSINYNGTNYLPIGKMAELFGFETNWDGNTRTATLTGENNIIEPAPLVSPSPLPNEAVQYEYYPGTTIGTYESVIGTPLIVYEYGIYSYKYTTSDNFMDYHRYLLSIGFDILDVREGVVSVSVSSLYARGSEGIMITAVFASYGDEVWIHIGSASDLPPAIPSPSPSPPQIQSTPKPDNSAAIAVLESQLSSLRIQLSSAQNSLSSSQTALANVKNERTVRVYIGGQWVWQADASKVAAAQANVDYYSNLVSSIESEIASIESQIAALR